MSLVNLHAVNLAFNEQVIFQSADLSIDAGYKYALVGLNGSGKSTFFRLLNQELSPDNGQIQIAKNCLISYLGQHPLHYLDELEHVYDNLELKEAETKLQRIQVELANLEAHNDANNPELKTLLDTYTLAQAEFERLGGYSFQANFKAAVAGLNLPVEILEQKPSSLSGGEKMKIALAHCLLRANDLILLDEPTNHLDLFSVEWLADFINKSKKTFIVVSHDRYFLDQISNRTIMLEGHKFTVYPGNYSQAQELAKERLQIQQRELDKLNDKLEHELEVKQTMLSHRNISGYHQREKVVNSLNSKIKDLRQSEIKKPNLRFSFNQPDSLGEKDYKRLLFSIKNLAKSYNKNLFSNLNLELRANEKIALVGGNGAGKTTLLKILLGEELADSGEIKLYGDLQIAYMGQIINFKEANMSLLDYMMSDNSIPERYIRSQLANYGFDKESIFKKLKSLSGGERHRIFLAKLINAAPDILFLDEPTNHLDLYSIECLESALELYAGAVVIVSHDRYFVNKIAQKVYGLLNCRLESFSSYQSWWQAYAQLSTCQGKSNIRTTKDNKREAKTQNDTQETSPTLATNKAIAFNRGKIRSLKAKAELILDNLLKSLDEIETKQTYLLAASQKDPSLYDLYNQALELQMASESLYLDLANELELPEDKTQLELTNWSKVEELTNNWPKLEKSLRNLFNKIATI